MELLHKALNDKDVNVQEAAKRALNRITERLN